MSAVRVRAFSEPGPVVMAFQDTAHSGASYVRKELANWTPSMTPPDAEILPELNTLVSRSRDLARNHGIAAGLLQTQVDNIVGTGLRLAAMPDFRALGKDVDWAENWARTTEALWRSWSNSFCCDAARRLTFNGLTQQILRATLMNGEVLALPLWLEDAQHQFATSFQLVEGDRLGNPDYAADSEHLRGGIEIDDYGKPLAYWFRKAPKNSSTWLWQGGGWFDMTAEWERIPARTEWGRPRVLHMFFQERVGQSRGKPLITSVLEQFKLFDHYQRAELQSSIVNALVAGIIETPMDQQAIANLVGDDPNGYLASKNEWRTSLQGGAMIPLYPGDKLAPFAPARPSSQYEHFSETQLRHIGAAVNLPYELLLKDFSKTNYSSARAALLEAWRYFLGKRQWLAEYWATLVYAMWLEEAVGKGLVEAPGFYEKVYYWTRCKWIGPGRGWIDPVKEAQASQVRMSIGISTREQECAEQGTDYQDTAEQIARERTQARDLGIDDLMYPQVAAAGGGAAKSPGTNAPRPPGPGSESTKEGEEYGE